MPSQSLPEIDTYDYNTHAQQTQPPTLRSKQIEGIELLIAASQADTHYAAWFIDQGLQTNRCTV